MERNLKYKTKQRAKIIDFLKENKEVHLTADDIINHFKNEEKPISKATVYRALESLLNENIIRKYVLQDKSSACYQFVESPNECQNHYHMKCLKCGNLVHLECEEINELQNHILKYHNFKIDLCSTVLYGNCENCL